jgi:hypothetical protein
MDRLTNSLYMKVATLNMWERIDKAEPVPTTRKAAPKKAAKPHVNHQARYRRLKKPPVAGRGTEGKSVVAFISRT